jgi:hypothetical protein
MAPPVKVLQPTLAPEPYYSPSLRKQFELDAALVQKPAQASTDKEIEIPEAVDFSYNADEARYLARTRKRALLLKNLPKEVPTGFPKCLSGPLVWKGDDFASDESQYVYYLTNADKAEIEDALKYFKG